MPLRLPSTIEVSRLKAVVADLLQLLVDLPEDAKTDVVADRAEFPASSQVERDKIEHWEIVLHEWLEKQLAGWDFE